jgi:hypothetical protein
VGVPYLESQGTATFISLSLWGLDFFTVVVEVLNTSCLSLKERI